MGKPKKESLLLDAENEDVLNIKVNEDYAKRFEVCSSLLL